MCVALTKYGYFIYDDLLDLPPGGWQGGFLPRTAPSYDENLRSLSTQVPIFVFELVERDRQQPLSAGFVRPEVRTRETKSGMRLRSLLKEDL